MVKITNDTPDKMRSTRQSVIIQTLLLIIIIAAFFIHQFYRDIAPLLYSVEILWIIIAIYVAYHEIDWPAFKLSLISFRGFCILISLIVNWACDILRHFLCIKYDKEPLLTIMMDNIFFVFCIMVMLAADSCPRVINLVRFLGPLLGIASIAIIIITEYILNPIRDYIIFTLYYGSLTVNEIEVAAKLQIIWFGFTFLWAAPRDPKHHHFVFLDNRIQIKTMIPMRKYIDAKKDILSECIMHGIAVMGVLYTVIYLSAISWKREFDDINISLVVIDTILMVLLCIFIVILMYKHFQWYMMKQLVLQFRINMMIACILILIYCALQKLVWKDPQDMNVKFFIETILNQIVFVFACVLVIIRDGLNISYPNYMIILFGILLNFVSYWNVLLYTFGRVSIKYPAWFILLEKQAYFQMIVISYLWLYYLWKDREGKYFSLIRKRKATDELWGNTDPMEHVEDSIEITTPHSPYISTNDSTSAFELHQQS